VLIRAIIEDFAPRFAPDMEQQRVPDALHTVRTPVIPYLDYAGLGKARQSEARFASVTSDVFACDGTFGSRER